MWNIPSDDMQMSDEMADGGGGACSGIVAQDVGG